MIGFHWCHTQLTRNTEIVNAMNRLGHGVSYSVLSKMHTGNAYIIQGQQQEDVILLINSQNESFTIYVEDNIDRKEETLSGINNFINAILQFISF